MSRIDLWAQRPMSLGERTLLRVHGPFARLAVVLSAVLMALVPMGASSTSQVAELDPEKVERGRYVVSISGCNDCHTSGFAQSAGNVPESKWLSGDSLGWKGPWGTTYPTNLRRLLASLSEDQWVHLARNMQSRPPMPWFNLRFMSDEDLRAIHHYVRFLGPSDDTVPDYVPPDREPPPPYVIYPSPPQ